MSIKYKVIDTPCWPDRWKVVPVGNFRESNSPTDYFPSYQAAQLECVRREKWRKAELQQTTAKV